MRGLLAKDFRLLANQKQFFATIVMIAVILMLSGQDIFFAIGYCTMLCGFFTISTINYDEYNNGFSFLFTMPITRRIYVLEKYLFALLIGGGVWLVTSMAGLVYNSVKNPTFIATQWIGSAVMILIVMGIMLCVMLPIQIKFGAEKSRVATFILMFFIFAVAAVGAKMMSQTEAEMEVADWISNMVMGNWLLIGGVAFIVAVAISILVSVRIMEKKQF